MTLLGTCSRRIQVKRLSMAALAVTLAAAIGSPRAAHANQEIRSETPAAETPLIPSAVYELDASPALTAEDVQAVASQYSLDTEYVSTTYTAPDGDVITVGVTGDAMGNLPAQLNDEVIATLSDMQADQARALKLDPLVGFSANPDPTLLPTEAEGYADDIAAALALARQGKLLFNQIVVRELPVKLPIGVEQPAITEPEEVTSDEDGTFAQADGTCGVNWSPYWAQTRVHPSSVEYSRYAVVDFYWNHLRMRNTKCRMNAIEPDFVLNNYDQQMRCGFKYCYQYPQTYLDHGIGSWATNMPYGYKDTQASDRSNEYVFTVGSQGVDLFHKKKHYVTYVRANRGNEDVDNGKLNFQDMKHCAWWYRGISPAWGLCGDDTARYIPAWEAKAPGDTTYSFG